MRIFVFRTNVIKNTFEYQSRKSYIFAPNCDRHEFLLDPIPIPQHSSYFWECIAHTVLSAIIKYPTEYFLHRNFLADESSQSWAYNTWTELMTQRTRQPRMSHMEPSSGRSLGAGLASQISHYSFFLKIHNGGREVGITNQWNNWQ